MKTKAGLSHFGEAARDPSYGYTSLMREVLKTPMVLGDTEAHGKFIEMRRWSTPARLESHPNPSELAAAIDQFERNGRQLGAIMLGVQAVEAFAEDTGYANLFDVVMMPDVPCTIGRLFGQLVYSETLIPRGLRELGSAILLIPGEMK